MNAHPMVRQALDAHRFSMGCSVGPGMSVEQIRAACHDGPGLLPADPEARAKVLGVWPELEGLGAWNNAGSAAGGVGAASTGSPKMRRLLARQEAQAHHEQKSLRLDAGMPAKDLIAASSKGWTLGGLEEASEILRFDFRVPEELKDGIAAALRRTSPATGEWLSFDALVSGEPAIEPGTRVPTCCVYYENLTPLAELWYAAGGIFRQILEELYTLEAKQLCGPSACTGYHWCSFKAFNIIPNGDGTNRAVAKCCCDDDLTRGGFDPIPPDRGPGGLEPLDPDYTPGRNDE